jgi:uncharacterized membrane protein YqhA
MGKYKKLTSIEILLILAIIAVLAVWLFPRFLKLINSNSLAVGMVKPYMEQASGAGITARSKLHDLICPLIADIKQT